MSESALAPKKMFKVFPSNESLIEATRTLGDGLSTQ